MLCARCAGLRVPEILDEGGMRVLALRCVHCGDVIDPVIILNRQRCRLLQTETTHPSIGGVDGERPTPQWPSSTW
jgi:hypothetical protein